MSERKEGENVREHVGAQESEKKNVITMQLCMAAENPFYVLIANRGDVLVARIVHSRVYEKDKGNVKNKTWRSARHRWSRVKTEDRRVGHRTLM